jgi:Uma2 family endonuclease
MAVTNLHPDLSFDLGNPPLIVQLRPIVDMTEDQFFEFCQINRDLRIERSAQGELILMPPEGGETGDRDAEITMQLRQWAKRDGTGTTFGSSTGFRLPNSAVRAPDAAWVRKSRLKKLTAEQKKKFLPLCPDFAIELRSPTDSLRTLQDKMQEYLDNGLRLGWLIDPDQKRVYIYRAQTTIEQLERPETVSGDPLLVGFVLDLREVW